MKRDLRLLVVEVGRKMKQEPHQLASDLERLSKALARHRVNLNMASLRKLKNIVTGKHKLSPEALNRLALFAGFQNWKSLSDALHGEVDASANYEEEPVKK